MYWTLFKNKNKDTDTIHHEFLYLLLFFRIVRNKAAERAKVNYTSSQQPTSESPVSQSSTTPNPNNSTNNVMSNSTGGSQGGPPAPGSNNPPPPLVSGGGPPPPMPPHGPPHPESSLLRPSYSINGILGIPQPDANANNINKRKREDDGKN